MPVPKEVEQVRQDLADLREELAQRFSTVDAAQAQTNNKLDHINGDVGKIKAEIGAGLPEADERGNRPTIRDRLHKVETDRDVIDQLSETLVDQLSGLNVAVRDMQTEREHARIERETQERIRNEQAKRWSQRKVVFVTACTGVGAVAGLLAALLTSLRLLGYGG